MLTATRYVRGLVLIGAALMASGGESLALPVAHLFADHHHEIVLSGAIGTWQRFASDDHHRDAAALEAEHHSHSDAGRAVTIAPFRTRSAGGMSLALVTVAVVGGGHNWQAATCSPDAPPDIGKPDPALLATMRV